MRGLLQFLVLPASAAALAPRHSWDYVANMTFFHSCNESGLFNEEALDTIARFPMVTIEKGQGFHDGTKRYAEEKIIEQIRAVKARDPMISTVFYMNAVLDWYFYAMHQEFLQKPEWWLRESQSGKPFYAYGDKHFNPTNTSIRPQMLVFDHSKLDVQSWWEGVCVNATRTGVVDGCFSDSSTPGGSHGTPKVLNATDQEAFEAGKVKTMTSVTAALGGTAGQPFAGSTGVLIGKKSDQKGINAFQIEMFEASNASIVELMSGVEQGYLVQAHVDYLHNPSTPQVDTLAAFLIGAGDHSYYGTGGWISSGLEDVQGRWSQDLFERPLGKPLGKATATGNTYTRRFTSGTWVEFNTHTNKGNIHWADAGRSPTSTFVV